MAAESARVDGAYEERKRPRDRSIAPSGGPGRLLAALPIRIRLTLWYVAILALVIGGLCAAVFFMARANMRDTLDDSLRDRAAVLLSSIDFDANGQPQLMLDPLDGRLADTFERLIAPPGSILVDNAPTYGRVPLEQPAVDLALNGRQTARTVDQPGDDTRLVTVPVRRGDAVVGVLQVGESTRDLTRALNQLLFVFALSAPVALVIAGLGGWWVAGRSLAPVNSVTQAAHEIAAGDLSRRLNLHLPDDEIGRLALTFDDMIGRLDETLRRQRRFTADASHELRTPIAAVRGQVEVALAHERDAEAYRGTLQTVEGELVRLTRLVEAMLFAARSESGSIQLVREELRAAELIDSVYEQAVILARDTDLAIQREPGPDLTFVADESLVLQLLLNLVDNAIRYTKAGSVCIGWRVAGERVELFVRDTGPGIPLEQQQHVFEPFYRLDPARTHPGGAGLGLSICLWIAEAHGGSIRVESAGAGRGSEFIFALPVTSTQ